MAEDSGAGLRRGRGGKRSERSRGRGSAAPRYGSRAHVYARQKEQQRLAQLPSNQDRFQAAEQEPSLDETAAGAALDAQALLGQDEGVFAMPHGAKQAWAQALQDQVRSRDTSDGDNDDNHDDHDDIMGFLVPPSVSASLPAHLASLPLHDVLDVPAAWLPSDESAVDADFAQVPVVQAPVRPSKRVVKDATEAKDTAALASLASQAASAPADTVTAASGAAAGAGDQSSDDMQDFLDAELDALDQDD